jgi:hypothetical protein
VTVVGGAASMGGKSASYALSEVSAVEGAAAFAPSGFTPGPSPFFERLVGNGFANLLRVRAEVNSALSVNGADMLSIGSLADALPPESIPSVKAGKRYDRVLAEIDQDGFSFAVDPLDAQFFERRARRNPRNLNLLHIVLFEGRVCIRKRYRNFRSGALRWGKPIPLRERVRRGVWNSLGLFLYREAAVLLRLSDVAFVPKLRAIDLVDGAIYVDYVQGETLRHGAARTGAAVYDQDLVGAQGLNQLSARELERREVALLDRVGGAGDFRREIAEMTRQINARGVAPLDIKLGNFIRGATTGRLYWIDFELACIQTQPQWEAGLRLQQDTLENLFDLGEPGSNEERESGEASEKVA